MSNELIVFSLAAAIMELDTVYAGQFLLSRPVIAGTILGYAAQNTAAGVVLGMWFELLYCGLVPVGSVILPSGVISVACAVIAADMFGMYIPAAFMLGLLGAKGFCMLEEKMRRMRSGWNEKIARQTAAEYDVVDLWIYRSLVSQFALGFIYLVLFGVTAAPLAAYIMGHAPEAVTKALRLGFLMVPWIGAAMLFENLREPKGKNG